MKKYFYKTLTFSNIFCLLFLLVPQILQSQDMCGTDFFHEEKLKTDSFYKKKVEEIDKTIREYTNEKKSSSNKSAGVIYRIPVVVHVMTTTTFNVNDIDIEQAIQRLNERFRNLIGTSIDVEIEFSLAARDPSGNCTNGIVRYDLSGNNNYVTYGVYSSGCQPLSILDVQLKSYSVWNTSQYLNIWVVNGIDGMSSGCAGVTGFSTLAPNHGSATDGIVIISSVFTSKSSTTFTHEVGHYLNLLHTFSGSSSTTCPTNTDCTAFGDKVCDTPPHAKNASCFSGTNSCDGGSSNALYFENFMSYCFNLNEFTSGQKDRMIAALTLVRGSLLESNGNMGLIPPLPPTVDFFANPNLACGVGSQIKFYDFSSCVPNNHIDDWSGYTFSWTFDNNAGAVYTSTNQDPTIAFNDIGIYDVTLTITGPAGSSSVIKYGALAISPNPAGSVCNGISSGSSNAYGIYAVKLQDIIHFSNNALSDKTSGVTDINCYGDFSCSYKTILAPNLSYSLSIKGSYSTTSYEDYAAYIDYNNNGDFTDIGEQIGYIDNVPGVNSSATGYRTINFTTPVSPTFNSMLRMRIMSSRGDETITPCGTSVVGETHDFGIYFLDPSSTTLSTELLTFDAVKDGEHIKTNWTTEFQINADFFSIMRSKNGIDFETIGTVKAHKNSFSKQDYIFYDKHPFEGISYYKLEQVDFNNIKKYSKVIPVYNGTDECIIFPNPANNVLNVIHDIKNKIVDVSAYSIDGKKVNILIKENTSENGKIEIDISSISTGVYFLNCVSEKSSQIIKFVKQ